MTDIRWKDKPGIVLAGDDKLPVTDISNSDIDGYTTPIDIVVAGGGGNVNSTLDIADNTIIRGDGGGKGIQESGIIIDDSDNITGILGITATGVITGSNLSGSNTGNQDAVDVPVTDTLDHFDGTNVEDVLGEIGETREINGYDLLDTASLPDLAFDNSTRTFSVSVKSGSSSFHFWAKNHKFTKTTTQTIVIPNVTGTYYIVFDNAGTLQYVLESAISSTNFYENAITGLVYWNATAQKSFVGNELHGILMDARTHHYNHNTFGARYSGGINIEGLSANGYTYTQTTSGEFWDEDIQHLIDAQSSSSFLYRLGITGEWTSTVADNKVSYKDGTDSYYSWNEWTGTTWKLTQGTSSTDYWIIFYVATPDINGQTIKKIIGQNAYDSVSNARNAIETEKAKLTTDGLPSPEFVFLYATIVWKGGYLKVQSDGSMFYDLRSTKGGVGGSSASSNYAGDIITDTTNFNGVLSTTDTNVQLALDTIDDITTNDVPSSTDKNYVTDSEKTVIANTSGTNTGDQDLSLLALKSNVLELNNTTAFTPDQDYEPATKKYVDDNGGGGGAVDSVNTQTGTVVLDTDDISDTATNRYTSDVDISRLANTSGTNTGDQTISDATITTSDITTNNVSTSKHGFAPKGNGSATAFLNGQGNYATPTGGGNVSTSGTPLDNDFAKFVNGTDIEGRSYTEVKIDLGLNNVNNTSDANKPVSTATQNALNLKVDKVTGKELSENDFTDTLKTKLDGIETSADVNNISDTNATYLTGGGASTLHYHVSDRARANHTGTQTASTISDFDAEVSNNPSVTTNTAKNTYPSTDSTKVGHISVTQAVNLDTMESNIVTNNAKVSDINHVASSTTTDLSEGTNLYYTDARVTANSSVTANTAKTTNATHTGEVTGSGALTISDNVIDEANLKLDTTPTNDYVLTADSTKTGGMKWAEAGGGGAFETTANVTSNSVGTLATDDFVFGSDSLADDGNSDHDRRMFFDKSKGAFRAGQVSGTQWDDVNVGVFSTAIGRDTTASGSASVAMGENTTASAGYSTAMGYNTTASGYYSTATGRGTTASGYYSTAIGQDTEAYGASSIAMGRFSGTNGNYSMAVGYNAGANGTSSIAMGDNVTISGDCSAGIGLRYKNDKNESLSIGYGTSNADTAPAGLVRLHADVDQDDTKKSAIELSTTTGATTPTNLIENRSGVLYFNGTALGSMSDLVNDTTPQLGGELDSQTHSIGFTLQTATGDGATTIDWKNGNKFKFTFGASNETFTFTAPTKPCSLTLMLVQDGTGGRTATFPATMKWAGGTATTLTTNANGIDFISMFYDGTNYYATSSLNFS